MTPLRAGILGCGGIAQKHAQAAATRQDEIELVAFCDTTAGKARSFAEQFTAGRAECFTDHRSMLERADLELLIVCLPPFAHTDEVQLAAARGIHLLIEKPIALSSELAWQMVAAAERAGIQSQVGFMYRFGAAVTRVKEQLGRGESGVPGLFSASYFSNALHAPWWRARDKSGGQVVEQVIHLFDGLRYLFGEPVSVYSRQANLFHRDVPGYSSEDVSATVCAFANGALGVIYATNGAIPGKWIKEWRVVTQNLVAEFSDWNNAVLTHTASAQPRSEIIAATADVFGLQLQDLVQAIRTNGETRTPIREGARSLDLVLAAARSAETRAEVSLVVP